VDNDPPNTYGVELGQHPKSSSLSRRHRQGGRRLCDHVATKNQRRDLCG
jgi:hypothetical protein